MGPELFTPIRLSGVELPNRVVVSPMCQYTSVDGAMNEWHVVHLGQYGLGGAGLVITEAAAVSPEGRISPFDAGLWDDACLESMRPVVEFFKAHTDSALGIQLAHAGRKASVHPPWGGSGSVGIGDGGWQTVAPSAAAYEGMGAPVALDRVGLDRIRDAFAAAAVRVDGAGFDLVEVHAAHGYLLHQFLSPLSNIREDEYGGALGNRMRFPLEVCGAVREAWPSDKPLGIRISATDWVSGGWDVEQSIEFASEVSALGYDVLTASSGGLSADQRVETGPGYQVPFARAVKAAVPDMKMIAVGMITEADQAEEILTSGSADLIAIAREFLYDPYWPRHAAHILGAEVQVPKQHIRGEPSLRPERIDRPI